MKIATSWAILAAILKETQAAPVPAISSTHIDRGTLRPKDKSARPFRISVDIIVMKFMMRLQRGDPGYTAGWEPLRIHPKDPKHNCFTSWKFTKNR